MNSNRRLRLGFAGLGWIGLHRMKAVLAEPHVEAVAICDASREAIEKAQAFAPGVRVADGFDDLLSLDLDGIVIATPSALHAQQTIRALEHGASVFCQKPLGRNVIETRAAVEAARAADRLLDVDFSYRFTQAAQAVRSCVISGELGDIFACDLTFHNAYGPDKPWFYDIAQSGGGCVMDLGVHLVDMALWITPDARIEHVAAALYSQGERLACPPDRVEDYATANIRLRSGAQVRIACSWNLHAGRDAVICAEFHGTKGGARMRNVNGSFYDFVAERFTGTRAETIFAGEDDWGGRAAVSWARKLGRSRAFDPSAEEIVHVAEALDLIYGGNATA